MPFHVQWKYLGRRTGNHQRQFPQSRPRRAPGGHGGNLHRLGRRSGHPVLESRRLGAAGLSHRQFHPQFLVRGNRHRISGLWNAAGARGRPGRRHRGPAHRQHRQHLGGPVRKLRGHGRRSFGLERGLHRHLCPEARPAVSRGQRVREKRPGRGLAARGQRKFRGREHFGRRFGPRRHLAPDRGNSKSGGRGRRVRHARPGAAFRVRGAEPGHDERPDDAHQFPAGCGVRGPGSVLALRPRDLCGRRAHSRGQ